MAIAPGLTSLFYVTVHNCQDASAFIAHERTMKTVDIKKQQFESASNIIISPVGYYRPG